MTADLVVFAEDWGRHPSSTQHLIRHLAADRRVLWVNSIGLRAPRFGASDLSRIAAKLSAARRQPSVEPALEPAGAAGPVRVLAPLAVPLPGNPVARAINRRLLCRLVRGAMATLGMERPILWTSLPTAVDAVGTLNERAVVYYCGDDFAALDGVDHGSVSAMEAELAERADLVLATSPALAAKFPERKTLLVPQGVDTALFGRPRPRPADLPPGPVAGFYGSLSSWIDTGLIAGTARRMPHWTFFLIGPARTDLSALAALPNVVLAGPRAHADLPAYAQHWTASLLPFRDTAQTRACNPLKLREYLATGTPVLSVDFPALDGYRDLVAVGRSPHCFARILETALEDDTAQARARRRARVAGETWSAAAARVCSALDGVAAR